MYFTQKIIAMLALLSVCTYSKLTSAGTGDPPCGPYKNYDACEKRCLDAGYGAATCTFKYVILNNDCIPLLTSIYFYRSCLCVSLLSYHISPLSMALY